MRGGLRTRILLASVVLVAFVAAAFTVLVVEIHNLRDAAALARRSEAVAAAANRVEKLAVDLETGQRGFVITENPAFLEPWESARTRIDSEAAALERLTVDPTQTRRARTIRAALRAYVEEWSVPVVEAAREDPERARKLVAAGGGKRRLDAIRAEFDRFLAAGTKLSGQRDGQEASQVRKAIAFGVAGLVGSAALILLFAGYLARTVVAPVRRLSHAAGQLRRGDLTARVPTAGVDEVGDLAAAFNAMAASLEENRDELESQNAELELQTADLEDQQARLATANDELAAQRSELEHAVEALATEKERIETFYEFGELLSSGPEAGSLAPTILQEICDIAGAEVGTLYTITPEEEDTIALHVARGVDEARLPAAVIPGHGLPGRAIVERRRVSASHGETGLQVPAFGEDVAVRHELHLPLMQGDRVVGVLTLARIADRPFSAADLETVEHLARQTAIRVSTRVAYKREQRLATINRAVLDATPAGISLVAVDGTPLLRNRTMERLLSEIFGKPADELDPANAPAVTTDPDRYREFMANVGADPDLSATDEFELVGGRSFEIYTRPVREGPGSPIGRLFIVREVTAEREAERVKNELVATVSHELRTPLASILGFAELLADRDPDERTRRRYVGTIYNEARRLTDLINDFLDLQRMEEGRFRLAIEPFELRELLAQQVDVFTGQSAAHTVELDLPTEPLPVAGERDRIAQVVGNLISNAIKYSPGGGPVKVGAARANGAVRVSVSDRGLGIPRQEQGNIFRKFFRVDTSDTREIGGTGLGLALSREIVEAHGGHIGFDSVPGEGSTFWFDLPAAQHGDGRGARRVLVVEDDPVAASLLGEYLGRDGYAVEVAASGEDALVRVATSPPDVVCLDITLAGELDGWHVLARLKSDPATAMIPVVVCTAGGERDRAFALGAADFLTKPFSAQSLRETVARLLPAGRGSVLVVDDEASVRALVVETLGGEGIDVGEAADGDEALDAVAAAKPDVIVLDLMMPKVDGFSVLERLQRDPETRSIPVVVLTARRLSADERSSLESRAVSLLEKSEYSAVELRRLIHRALGEKTLNGVEQL